MEKEINYLMKCSADSSPPATHDQELDRAEMAALKMVNNADTLETISSNWSSVCATWETVTGINWQTNPQ